MAKNNTLQDADDIELEDADLDAGGDLDEGEAGEADDAEWESYDDEESVADDAESTAPAKKKSSNFNRIVIIGAMIVGGAVMYMKVMGGGSPPSPAVAPESPPAQTAEASPSAPTGAEPAFAPSQMDMIYAGTESAQAAMKNQSTEGGGQTPASPAGFLENPEEVQRQVEQIRQGGDFITPEQSPGVADIVDIPEVNDAVPMPAPLGSVEQEPLTPMPGTEPETQTQTQTKIQPAVPAASNLPTAQDISIAQAPPAAAAPSVDLDVIYDRIDELETKLQEVSRTPATGDGDIRSLREDVSALVRRVDDLSKKLEAGSAPVAEPPNRATRQDPDNSMQETSGQPSAVVRPKRVSEPVPERKATSPQKISWVLKSAQPGKALVARQGQGETFSVGVGDSLPGIGKITSIANQGGQWVVTGTAGQIFP